MPHDVRRPTGSPRPERPCAKAGARDGSVSSAATVLWTFNRRPHQPVSFASGRVLSTDCIAGWWVSRAKGTPQSRGLGVLGCVLPLGTTCLLCWEPRPPCVLAPGGEGGPELPGKEVGAWMASLRLSSVSSQCWWCSVAPPGLDLVPRISGLVLGRVSPLRSILSSSERWRRRRSDGNRGCKDLRA